MAGRILQEDVEEVKARVNIADVIGERITLKSAGVGSLKGLCPFHDERSPSFHVRPQQGFYHCFGCGESGDVYSFLRQSDMLSFTEAVERLAARIGYVLRYEEGSAPSAPSGPNKTRLYQAHQEAAAFYQQQLASPEASAARTFLGERGFDQQAATTFGVGYAPKGWNGLRDHLRAKGFKDDELLAGGLLSQGKSGSYDRFRGRLVWPIRDVTGQVIGFGARKLYDDDQGPKYLNTPETPIYHKNQVLYGLDLAKRDISKLKSAVIVEGYTDVMACHLAGIKTAVASCGTAFGADHIRTLRRVMGDDSTNGEVIFTFDPDAAGQKAALRAFSEEKRFSAQSYVAVAPEGLDPCDLRLERGDGALREIMATKVPMFEFVIDQHLAGFNLNTVEGQMGALLETAPIVAQIKDPLLRPGYTRLLARRLGLELAQVNAQVRRSGSGSQPLRRAQPSEDRSVSGPISDGVSDPRPKIYLRALPNDPQTALERDSMMAFLQFGPLLDQSLLAAALRIPLHNKSLEFVRRSMLNTEGLDRADWGVRVVSEIDPALSVLAAELLSASFPARDQEHAIISAHGLAKRLLINSVSSRKTELLRQVQRVEANSEEGLQLRLQLRDLDQELRALRDD